MARINPNLIIILGAVAIGSFLLIKGFKGGKGLIENAKDKETAYRELVVERGLGEHPSSFGGGGTKWIKNIFMTPEQQILETEGIADKSMREYPEVIYQSQFNKGDMNVRTKESLSRGGGWQIQKSEWKDLGMVARWKVEREFVTPEGKVMTMHQSLKKNVTTLSRMFYAKVKGVPKDKGEEQTPQDLIITAPSSSNGGGGTSQVSPPPTTTERSAGQQLLKTGIMSSAFRSKLKSALAGG